MNIEAVFAELVSSIAGQYALYLAGGVLVLLAVVAVLLLLLLWIVWRWLVRPWRASRLAKRKAERIDCIRLKEYSVHVERDMRLVSRLSAPAERLDVLDRLVPRLAELTAMYPDHKKFRAFYKDMTLLRAALLPPPPAEEEPVATEAENDAPVVVVRDSRLALAASGIKRVLALPVMAMRVKK